VIEVGEFTVTALAASPPNVTLVAAVKLEPVSVTTLPPPSGPETGLTDAIAGADSYVKRSRSSARSYRKAWYRYVDRAGYTAGTLIVAVSRKKTASPLAATVPKLHGARPGQVAAADPDAAAAGRRPALGSGR